MALTDEIIPSRCEPLDDLLGGGFTVGEVVVVYGEARTGKTTLALQTAVEAARRGLKVIYVDADHSFTHQRFTQLAGEEPEAGERILLFFPDTFSAQTNLVESIENYLTMRTRLVIIDTITSLYRVSLGSAQQTFILNRELNRQLAYLSEVAARHKLVALLTSQVHARLDFPFGRIRTSRTPNACTLASYNHTIKEHVRTIKERDHCGTPKRKTDGSLKCSAYLTAHGFEAV